MQKLSFKIDLSKIDKSKILERKYLNKNNEEVIVKEYEFEAILNKDELIKAGAGYDLYKIGFITGKGKKLENGEYSKEPIFGSLIEFRNKGEVVQGKGMEDITAEFTGAANNPDDIPF